MVTSNIILTSTALLFISLPRTVHCMTIPILIGGKSSCFGKWLDAAAIMPILLLAACQDNTNPKGQGHTNRASARRTLREIEIEIEIEIGI